MDAGSRVGSGNPVQTPLVSFCSRQTPSEHSLTLARRARIDHSPSYQWSEESRQVTSATFRAHAGQVPGMADTVPLATPNCPPSLRNRGRLGRYAHPGCVGPQHRYEAVSVLLGEPEQIPARHQIPAHRRVTRNAGWAVPKMQRLKRLAPSPRRRTQVADRLPVGRTKITRSSRARACVGGLCGRSANPSQPRRTHQRSARATQVRFGVAGRFRNDTAHDLDCTLVERLGGDATRVQVGRWKSQIGR